MFGWFKRKLNNTFTDMMRDDMERFSVSLQGSSATQLAMLVAIATNIRLNLVDIGRMSKNDFDVGFYKGSVEQMSIPIYLGNAINEYQRIQEPTHAAATMVWLHSIRAIQNPELRVIGRNMWGEIRRGFLNIDEQIEVLESLGYDLRSDITMHASFIPPGLEPEWR